MEKELQMEFLYNQGYTLREIAKELKVCPNRTSKILKSKGFILKTGPEYQRLNFFNENYFAEIDCAEKAYFLGLLYADGNVYLKRNRVQITLINEDAYILLELCKRINHTGRLYIDRVKYSKLILDSKKMCKDLIKLGCIPNKCFVLKFPTEEQVPKAFQRHFIRGYFDGDGNITRKGKKGYTVSFTGTEAMCNSISSIFHSLGIQCSKFRKRYKNKVGSSGSTKHYETEENDKIYHYLYNNSSRLYLIRKFKKFKNETI